MARSAAVSAADAPFLVHTIEGRSLGPAFFVSAVVKLWFGAKSRQRRRNLVPASIGLLMQGSNLGQVLGSAVVGLAISGIGWTAAASLVASLALLAVLVSFGLRRDLAGLALSRAPSQP